MNRTCSKKTWAVAFRAGCLVVVMLAILQGPATAAVAASGPFQSSRGTPTFVGYSVSLWPEYDDQRTLVIQEPELDQSVKLPYRMSYLAPLDAQIGMTCQIEPSGKHS